MRRQRPRLAGVCGRRWCAEEPLEPGRLQVEVDHQDSEAALIKELGHIGEGHGAPHATLERVKGEDHVRVQASIFARMPPFGAAGPQILRTIATSQGDIFLASLNSWQEIPSSSSIMRQLSSLSSRLSCKV